MSLSSQFEKSRADFQQTTRNASIAKLSGAMEKIADSFASAAQGIIARKAKGREPSWFQKRKTEKWVWSNKGLSGSEVTPAFLEEIPGFRKLRDACADPKTDIKLVIYVGSGDDPSIHISVDPTRPFRDSLVQPSGNGAERDFFCEIDVADSGPRVKPGKPGTGANQAAPPKVDMQITVPAAPAADASTSASANGNSIAVLPQLRLKK